MTERDFWDDPWYRLGFGLAFAVSVALLFYVLFGR